MYVQKVTGMHLVESLLGCIVHAHNLTPGTINVLCSFIDRYARVFSEVVALTHALIEHEFTGPGFSNVLVFPH